MSQGQDFSRVGPLRDVESPTDRARSRERFGRLSPIRVIRCIYNSIPPTLTSYTPIRGQLKSRAGGYRKNKVRKWSELKFYSYLHGIPQPRLKKLKGEIKYHY